MSQKRTNPLPYVAALAAMAACALVAAHKPVAPARPSPDKPAVVKKEEGAAPAKAAAHQAAQRVVLVTVDGLHVKLTDRMPVWQELVRDGSWTLKARVPKGATTVISHAALYTGADPNINGIDRELDPVTDKDPHVHGWKFRWKAPPLKVAATLFTAVEDAGYKATAVVQKGKLVQLLRPNGDETGIHEYDDAGLIKAACKAAKDDDVRLVILHIASPDAAGHEHGWLSDEQYRAAEQVSGQLQDIRKCLADAEAAGGIPSTLIITSDHGGTPGTRSVHGKVRSRGHGANDDDNRLVPLAIVGSGIKAGHEIVSSVGLTDVSATVLRILGIPTSAIPTLSGSSIDEVFAAQ